MKPDYLEKLLPDSQSIVLLSQSESVPAVQVVMLAVENKRAMLRKEIEEHPKHSPDELEDDLVFMLGMIKGLNWALGLPARSREIINKIT